MYKSNDFYASAFIVASGIPLQDHYRDGQITTFVFKDSDQVHDLLDSYYSLQGTITPVHYASALKNLKSIIHSAYTNTNKSRYTNYEQQTKGGI